MVSRILIIILTISFYLLNAQTSLIDEINAVDTAIKKKLSNVDDLKNEREELQLQFTREQLREFALPKLEDKEELVEHKAMYLVYSEKHEQAKWVSHIISTKMIEGRVSRTNDFREDPKIKTGSSTQEDFFFKFVHGDEVEYSGLGYDRGHLAPSADFRWSQTALSESYFYSNMSPQLSEFNREGWADLEKMLRKYVYAYNTDLFVITAPVLTDDLEIIHQGVNKVSIPNYFYKIAFDKKNKRAFAFLIPHKKLEYNLEHYLVSIDSIENLTGIDFFYKLPDDIENDIEKQSNFLHFVSKSQKIEIEPIEKIKENQINIENIKEYIDKEEEIIVCGTVVVVRKSNKGQHVFANLDKSYPDNPLAITIWGTNLINFSYKPSTRLLNKRICIRGKITEHQGIPTMQIKNEKQIEFLNSVHD